MKLHVTSDLHLDYDQDYGHAFVEAMDPEDADAIIIAGDFMEARRGSMGERTDALKKICEKYPLVLMTMGNHDFYGSSFKEVNRMNEELQYMFRNLIVLEPGQNYIHKDSGLKIAGGVLWYPETPEMPLLKGGWPDFRLIKYTHSPIFEDNKLFRTFLFDLKPEHYPDIVVSHMLPSYQSVAKEFEGSKYNCFFVSDEEETIKKIKPKLWIHGHTHYPFDYKLHDTRIFCNPRGYPREGANPNFIKRMKIEL